MIIILLILLKFVSFYNFWMRVKLGMVWVSFLLVLSELIYSKNKGRYLISDSIIKSSKDLS